MIRSEKDLVDLLDESFKMQGFVTAREVRMLSKFIDLVAYSAVDDGLVAVEAKLSGWRRAFQQAMTYRICADGVYIAVPAGIGHRVDMELLKRYGIGLIIAGEDEVHIIFEAERIRNSDARLKDAMIAECRMGGLNGRF